MLSYEKQYMTILEEILRKGYYDQNRTGVATYKLPHQVITIDLEKEFPILQSKKVFFNTAIKEMLWIYRDQSNDVTKLQEQNVHIWDSWVDENNTIGKGYGYQIAKFKQIDKLIETLKTNPQDRRMIMTMWNIEDLPEMTLQPCCFQTLWDVTNGRLNCMLIQRSADWLIGGPFNSAQYATLVHMIAQVTGLKPGIFTHIINNCHVYENQLDGAKEQLERYRKMELVSGKLSMMQTLGQLKNAKPLVKELEKELEVNAEYKEIVELLKSKPTLKLNQEIKDFYDFTIDDIGLEDYKSLSPIKMPVSV